MTSVFDGYKSGGNVDVIPVSSVIRMVSVVVGYLRISAIISVVVWSFASLVSFSVDVIVTFSSVIATVVSTLAVVRTDFVVAEGIVVSSFSGEDVVDVIPMALVERMILEVVKETFVSTFLSSFFVRISDVV